MTELSIYANAVIPYLPRYKYQFLAQLSNVYSTKIARYSNLTEFAIKEPELFNEINKFYNEYYRLVNNNIITKGMFNLIIAESVILPDQIKHVIKYKIKTHGILEAILNELVKNKDKNNPASIYPKLAVLKIAEFFENEVKRAEKDSALSKKTVKELQRNLDGLRALAIKFQTYLLNNYITNKSEIMIEPNWEKAKLKHCFYDQRCNFHSIKLTDGVIAKNIGILGSRGSGKTIMLMSAIQSALNQGYNVLALGEDERHEFRFASFPIRQDVNETMYNLVKKQRGKPKGMPITIYCDDPYYPIEKPLDITWENLIDKRGRKYKEARIIFDWDNIKGVTLFDTKQFIPAILKSLYKWRRNNRRMKLMLVLNEAQNFCGSKALDSRDYSAYGNGAGLLNNIRGLNIPVVMNTQRAKKVDKSARDWDEVFMSYISQSDERITLSKDLGMPSLKTSLQYSQLKKEKKFVHVIGDKIEGTVKSLLPSWMPENNKFSLNKLFKM